MAHGCAAAEDRDMTEQSPTEQPGHTEQSTTDPQTGLDTVFASLRRIPVRRRTDDTWFRGVCSGLADRLGVDPVIVRAALILLSLIGGIGITLYLVAWALLPNDREEIVAQRALRDGDGGAIVVLVFAALMLFSGSALGGSWWGNQSGWGFPWGLALTGLLIWWLVQRSRDNPVADQRVSALHTGAPFAAGPSPTTFSPSPTTFGPSPTTSVPPPAASRPAVPGKPRRRSGGALMALLAIGLALVTYGALSWLAAEYSWTGDHRVIALAGSLAATGLLLVALGLAGWRAGFVAFLAVLLSISVWTSAVAPAGIQLGGRVGDATWTPTSATPGEDYRLGAGDGVLDLTRLPVDGLREARLPAYVGVGQLKVVVPEGLTVRFEGHVGLGKILLPGESEGEGQGGTDISRSVVVGDGPIEVIVDAGVGVGQLTVVKE
jgi:phage shock protein PspC (stress-responsive transcriptional regulator)